MPGLKSTLIFISLFFLTALFASIEGKTFSRTFRLHSRNKTGEEAIVDDDGGSNKDGFGKKILKKITKIVDVPKLPDIPDVGQKRLIQGKGIDGKVGVNPCNVSSRCMNGGKCVSDGNE